MGSGQGKNRRVRSQATSTKSVAAVKIGDLFTIKDLSSKKSLSYKLTSPAQGSSLLDSVSTDSPVGRAVLGKKKGEVVEVRLPNGGARSLRITQIVSAPKATA